jgi:predicted amidohydrolase YtcJ
MLRRSLLIAAASALIAACAHGPAEPDTADLVIRGGPVYTAVEAAPEAEAVAVKRGEIVFVGSAADAARRIGRDTRVIELNGRALFPGFVDGHAHLRGIGERELTLNLEGTASIADLVRRVAERVAATPRGQAIVGRGWIETHWPEKRFPTRQDLDRVSPDHPVILGRADGHAAVVNTAALKAAGVTRDTAAPAGGEILKDAAGEPTGMLIDNAERLVASLIAAPSDEERLKANEVGAKVYAAYGWTGLHNMSVDPADRVALERLTAEGRLPLRVYNALTPEGAAGLFAGGAGRTEDGRVETRAIKLYVDGALGSRGALLHEPYADAPGTRGLQLMTKDEALAVYEQALREGVQITTHAIGDRGNTLVLDWYAETFAKVPPAERAVAEPRWRIEHAQVVRPHEIPRFAELDVIASMQPSHAIGDLHFAPARLGDARLDGAYAWRSMLAAGAVVVGGSDAPVERGDPLIEFYAAVARQDLKGFSAPNWRPGEALDRQAALRLFTAAPAFASFQEDVLGTIEVGKRADFTVFSVDLMTAPVADIPKGKALLTVVDGVVAYRAEGF